METSWKRIIIISVTIFLLLWGCEEFLRRKIGGFAGSYPYAETWEVDASETEVIEIIKQIKITHPELQPPYDTALISCRTSYWNYVTFYFLDTKELVHTWTREAYDTSRTTVALVSFSPVDNPNEQHLINKDYWFFANLKRREKFEKRIINQIKERLNNAP